MTRYDENYVQSIDTINAGLNARKSQLPVNFRLPIHFFPWGEYFGANLAPKFLSFPHAIGNANDLLSASPVIQNSISPAERWTLLDADPFSELRLLTTVTARSGEQTPVSAAFAERLFDLADAIAQPSAPNRLPVLYNRLHEAGLSKTFPLALHHVIQIYRGQREQELHQVLLQISAQDVETYKSVIARCLVALAITYTSSDAFIPQGAYNAPLRDNLVTEIENILSESDEMLGGGVKDRFLQSLSWMFVNPLLRHNRQSVTKMILSFFGDILVYQRQRHIIGTAIRDQIRSIDDTVVVLAHSLGGIACVEALLLEDFKDKVPLLITVGSQTGLLYEIDALRDTLPYRDQEPISLPIHMPPWLNIYDPNDMLSFCIEPLFRGNTADRQVDNMAPFPHAHSAYWANSDVWEFIVEAISDPSQLR